MTGAISKVTDAVGLSDTGAAGKATREASKVSAKAAGDAAKIAAGSQREALDYLKETERLPQQYRERALGELEGLYLDGEYGADVGGRVSRAGDLRDRLMASAQDSPFYAQSLDRGEEAILRGASATGGLRSGTTSENLSRFGEEALMRAYQQEQQGYQGQLQQEEREIQGIRGLAGLPSYAPQIAAGMTDIGRTEAGGVSQAGQATAYGISGQAQADIAAEQQNLSGLLDMGKLAVSGGWF